MRLDELIGVKAHYDKDIEEILSDLEKYGFEKAGRGHFSVVLKTKNPNEVIKFWIKDSAYDSFIDYVSKNPSKYFPKLLSKPKSLSAFFTRPVHFPEKVNYVRMEALDSIEGSYMIANWISSLVRDLAEAKSSDEKIADIIEKAKTKVDITSIFKDVEDFCKVIVEFLKSKNVQDFDLDLHSGNIMKRANGDYVITDPTADSTDIDDLNYIKMMIKDLKKYPEDIKSVKGKTPKAKT